MLNNSLPPEFAEYAVDFGVGNVDEQFIVGRILPGRIGDVADFVRIAVPEIFHEEVDFIPGLREALDEFILLPLFHEQD